MSWNFQQFWSYTTNWYETLLFCSQYIFVVVDILKKETDRNQYFLSTSCHPAPTSKAIPYSLYLRIVRTCTDIIKRDIRLQKLKNSVLARVYSSRSWDAAIKRAKSIPREVALIKVPKQNLKTDPIFALTYDPRLSSITKSTVRHWGSFAHRDSPLASVFQIPPSKLTRGSQT